MNLQLLRKPTQAGVTLSFEFAVSGSRFLVKNFTEDDIYVSFDSGEQNEILIPAECSQVCITGETGSWIALKTDIVYIRPISTSEKGVEVQCLKW